MRWNVSWSVVAAKDLLDIHWRLASRVDANILAFAAGRNVDGLFEQVAYQDYHRYRLRMRGAIVLLRIDVRTRVVYVMRVFSH